MTRITSRVTQFSPARNPNCKSRRLYAKADERLKRAAERNVLAHLLKLQEEGRAVQLGDEPPAGMPPFGMKTDDREMLVAAYLEMARKDAQREFSRV